MQNKNLRVWIFFRILYGGIFVFSGYLKLISFDQFVVAVSKFKIIDAQYIQTFSYAIPLIEILLGLLLILKAKPALILQILVWMVSFFTAIVVAKIFEGEEISCQCFGNLTTGTIDWLTVFRNILLIGFGIALTSYYSVKQPTNFQEEKIVPGSIAEKLRQKKWYYYFQKSLLATIFFFLAVQCLILALQNRGLKENISLLITQNETLQPGDIARPISAYDLDSSFVKIDFKVGIKTILYILSVKCEPCKANMSNWIKLSEALRNTDVNIVGVAVNSIDEIKKYESNNNINFQLLSGNNLEFKVNYKAFTTPQTVIIEPNGKVLRSYPGVLNRVSFEKLLTDLSLKDGDNN